MYDPLFRPEPTQLMVAGDCAPEATHIGGDRFQTAHDHDRSECIDRRHAYLGAAADGEREPMALEVVAGIGREHDVGRRIGGGGMHCVGTGKGPGGWETHIPRGDADYARHQPFTAPTSRPRAMNRSRAMAIAMTGPIMIRMSTDMYHHCGPRVAFWAATVSGSVWAFALVGKRASKHPIHAKTRTNRKVATSPGTASGTTIDRKMRYRDAPSVAAPSSTANGNLWK